MSFFRNEFFRHQQWWQNATHGKNSAPCDRRYPGTPRTESLGIRSVGFADGSISAVTDVTWGCCNMRCGWPPPSQPQKPPHFLRIRPRPDQEILFQTFPWQRFRNRGTDCADHRHKWQEPPKARLIGFRLLDIKFWGEFSLTRSIQLNGPMEFDRVDW